MPTVSRHVSASASGSASKRAPTAPGLGLQDSGGDLGGRGEPCGFAAVLGRRWRAAHNSTGPTTAKRDTHLTRKRSGLHLTNALLWSRVSGRRQGLDKGQRPGTRSTVRSTAKRGWIPHFHPLRFQKRRNFGFFDFLVPRVHSNNLCLRAEP